MIGEAIDHLMFFAIRALSGPSFRYLAREVDRKIKENGGLNNLLKGIALDPKAYWVPKSVVEKRFLVGEVSALARQAVGDGRMAGYDTRRYAEIYRKCSEALEIPCSP